MVRGTMTLVEQPVGRRVMIKVDGITVECGTIGVLAATVGRSTSTVRRWIRSGLLPDAPFRVASEDIHLQRRLYPLVLIEAISEVTAQEGFGRRRPSAFWRQQELLYKAWNTALAPIMDNSEQGVGDTGDEMT